MPLGRTAVTASGQRFEHLRDDLGDFTVEENPLLADGEMVAGHDALHGQRMAPRCCCKPGSCEPSTVVWTFLHLFRVTNGKTIEHWAYRDDVGLLRQVGARPPP